MALIQRGIKCVECGEDIYSNHRHDFVACRCGSTFIDGGFDYQRIGYDNRMPITVERTLEHTPETGFRDEKMA